MTSIHIEPNYEKKTAHITKEVVAAGEKVAVSIEMPNYPFQHSPSLRLRVFCGHHVIAQFPAPDTDDEWQIEKPNLVCILNLNTVQARRICRGPETPVLLVLEDIGDAAQLYFTEEWNLKGWPGIETDEKPTDLSVYAFPTLVTAWRNELATAGSRINALESASATTNSNLASEHNRVTQLTTRVENEEARATAKEIELAEDINALDASVNALELTHNNDKAALTAAIAGESRQRAEADAGLRSDIGSVSETLGNSVNSEERRASAAENALREQLQNEITAREAADSALTNLPRVTKVNGVAPDASGAVTIDAAKITDTNGGGNTVGYWLQSMRSGIVNLNRDKADTTYVDSALSHKANLVDGRIPASELPSYVDDVLEFANLDAFPHPGESGKIYIAKDTNKTYRWGDSVYVEISNPVVLGDTDGTAFPGPRGKILEETVAALPRTAEEIGALPLVNKSPNTSITLDCSGLNDASPCCFLMLSGQGGNVRWSFPYELGEVYFASTKWVMDQGYATTAALDSACGRIHALESATNTYATTAALAQAPQTVYQQKTIILNGDFIVLENYTYYALTVRGSSDVEMNLMKRLLLWKV